MQAADLVAQWEALGERRAVGEDSVFVVDAPATEGEDGPPLLVVHGYPTSSIDYATVLPALRARRRVLLLDLPGYGFSDKPDRRYSLFDQAGVVEAVVAGCEVGEVDLLTHDMGDSVGGELLARSLDGTLGFGVRRRVVTNGSIYLDMAQLTDGQQLLLSLPDESLDADLPLETIAGALHALLRPDFPADDPHLLAASELVVSGGGGRLQPRLIRYVEERREHEGRWTGAIESHPSPLAVVWGDLDPVAVYPMAEELHRRRPDAAFTRLDGVGHYPMIEAPERFADAVLSGLG